MSRKVNKLKNRLAEEKKKLRALLAAGKAADQEILRLTQQLTRKAALTITVEHAPDYGFRNGTRMRLDWEAVAFEYGFLRSGTMDVTGYCVMIGHELARKVSDALIDHISKRSPNGY
jgi:hypothetical protein